MIKTKIQDHPHTEKNFKKPPGGVMFDFEYFEIIKNC
jgi:hypothetical protein